MNTRNLSSKKISLTLLLTVVSLLVLSIPVLSAEVTLLNDGFEISPYLQNWDDNGATNWTPHPGEYHTGHRSVRAVEDADGLLTSDDLDTSDATSIVVDFWYRKTNNDAQNFSLYYYDGSNYDLIVELDSLGDEDTWLQYTETITDPQYFISNFRIRFDGTMNDNAKAYVDDVLITKNTGELLEVFKSGTGSGTVTSSPAGIDCGLDCNHAFDLNTEVTLIAEADPGSTFSGWSGGGCSGTDTCSVTMTEAISVTATFTQDEYTLTTDMIGQGTIEINPDLETYIYNDVVTLTATADFGWNFVGWSGDITSFENPLLVTIQDNTSITATFTTNLYSLGIAKDGTGSGTVTSDPPGIDCGLDCSEDYDYNTVVTLTAVADTGSTFTGWDGGGCTGTATCEVTMDEAKYVNATFTLDAYTLSVITLGTGSGTVTSDPPGINCGLDCSEDYDYNSVVTLTAVADADSTFMGWSGAGCTGTGTCEVTMNEAKSVTAEFTQTNFPIFLPIIFKP